MKTQVWYASVNVGTLKGDGPKLKVAFRALGLARVVCRCHRMQVPIHVRKCTCNYVGNGL